MTSAKIFRKLMEKRKITIFLDDESLELLREVCCLDGIRPDVALASAVKWGLIAYRDQVKEILAKWDNPDWRKARERREARFPRVKGK